MLFPQTIKDITMIYNDLLGLQMSFSEWRKFCGKAWQKRDNYTQIDKDKDLDDMNRIKNSSGLEIGAVPETTAFQKKLTFIINHLVFVETMILLQDVLVFNRFVHIYASCSYANM